MKFREFVSSLEKEKISKKITLDIFRGKFMRGTVLLIKGVFDFLTNNGIAYEKLM